MKNIVVILLLLLCISCHKERNKSALSSKETSNKYINFNNYTFNTITGNQEKIKLVKGKKYILDFWYVECAPCVKQHKEIAKYQKKLIKNNIEVIGISIDRSQENWRNYLKKHGYNWKNYNQYYDEKILKNDLNIKLFPRYFIVDVEGIIYNTFNSFQKVIKHLNL